MTRRFDPATLFTTGRAPRMSERAELTAVATRRKALSYDATPLPLVAPRLPALLRVAATSDLAVVVTANTQVPGIINLQLLPLEQSWRILAINTLDETRFLGGDQSGGERQQSTLFGYSKEQQRSYSEHRQRRSVANGCAAMYVLCDAACRRSVESVGRRCLGPLTEGMTVFRHPWRPYVKQTARALVPKGLVLGRFGLDWDVMARLFASLPPQRAPQLDRAVITKAQARELAEGMRTNVQFLTRRGWQ
ncbi:MAG: hypothetical protein ABI867_35855 [Kofleriaceae bacterium]